MTETTETKRDTMASLLYDAWDTVDAVGSFSPGVGGDRVTVYFEELPYALSKNDIGGGGTYRFVSIHPRGTLQAVTVEIREYPETDDAEHGGGD